MRCWHLQQAGCIVFLFFLVFLLFFSRHKEPPSVVKLKANGKRIISVSAKSQNKPLFFVPPPKNKHSHRERSPGVIEVESNVINSRRVMPFVYERDGKELPRPAKADTWQDTVFERKRAENSHQRKRSRKTRSALSKKVVAKGKQRSVNDVGKTNDTEGAHHYVNKRQAVDPDKPIPQSLPDSIRRAVVNALVNTHHSKSRSIGTEVALSCQNEAVEAFRQEIPMLRTRWLLNGEALVVKPSRMLFRGDDLLVIRDLTPKDTGVYECQVEFGNSQALTLAVFALTVTSNFPTLFVRETEPLYLDSHSFALAQVLRIVDLTKATDPLFGCKPPCLASNLSHRTTRQWYFNKTSSTLLPDDIPVKSSIAEKINASTKNMSGVWWCQVSHPTSSKPWKTSWYRVLVQDPPSDLERWWNAALRRPWVVSVVGVLLLGTCIGLSVLVARYSQKQHENLEIRWQKTKNRLLRRETDLVVSLSAISQESSQKSKVDTEDVLTLSGNGDVFTAMSTPRLSSRTSLRSHPVSVVTSMKR